MTLQQHCDRERMRDWAFVHQQFIGLGDFCFARFALQRAVECRELSRYGKVTRAVLKLCEMKAAMI